MHESFDLARHAREYQYDYVTVVGGILSDDICVSLRERIDAVIA